jgi:hypothetical protein
MTFQITQHLSKRAMGGAALAAATLAIAAPAQASLIIDAGTAGTTGQTALYITDPAQISAEAGSGASADELNTFLGAPDGNFTGLGEFYVDFDLGGFRLFDGMGQDFNVYEADFGAVEFDEVDILVSINGTDFFSVSNTSGTGLDLAGDEVHGNANFRQSYDLGGAVAALGGNQFQFVRIEGTNGGPIGGINDFDFDGLGFANFQAVGNMGAVPEPTTWAMLILGFGMVGGTMRRRGSQSMRLRTA